MISIKAFSFFLSLSLIQSSVLCCAAGGRGFLWASMDRYISIVYSIVYISILHPFLFPLDGQRKCNNI
jgi:hypothetical protein